MFAYSIQNMDSPENKRVRQAITLWVIEFLASPDKKLANAILPILVDEFENFNDQISRR